MTDTGPATRPGYLGGLVALLALAGVAALIVAAALGVPPFAASPPTASPSPTPSPSAPPSAPPSPSPSPSPLSDEGIRERLAAIERRMTEVRELAAGESPSARLVSSAEASAILLADFERENPSDFLADQTLLYRALGLLEQEADLGAIYERFLSTQVLGFYRSDDRSLYVVSDRGFGPLAALTAAHEYTHHLQDLHFGLDTLQPEGHDQGDLSLARVALIEGDATLAMTQWAITDLTVEELTELFDELDDPAADEALADLPPIVRDVEAFPYLAGREFVQRAWAEGGWDAVDAVWRDPPSTAEQILHPAAYDRGEEAIRVDLPARLAAGLGTGWELALADTHGELIARIWLEIGNEPDVAADAATGWSGDRVGLYRGRDAWALVWLTRWDSDDDAAEFAAAARAVAVALDGSLRVIVEPDGRSITILAASAQAVSDTLVGLLP